MFGNSASIYGTCVDDYNSVESIQAAIDTDVNSLILGDIFKRRIEYYKLGEG